MNSELVLLCAPYRFDSSFLTRLNENIVKKELFTAVMSGINPVTRNFVKLGLKNNYGISDKESLINTLDSLQRGDFQLDMEIIEDLINGIEDMQIKEAVVNLRSMTGKKGIQGFDDCRIIDTLTKAYAGKIIEEDDFNILFNEHAGRIKDDYQSWEQYLSSCVLGKLFQGAQKSFTITTEAEFISDVYGYCIAAVNVFSFTSFWKNHNLDNLGRELSKLLNADYAQDKAEVLEKQPKNKNSEHAKYLSDELIEHFSEKNIDAEALIDMERYDYLSRLAEYVLWQPVVENGLEWLFTPLKGEQDTLLMPKEFFGLASAEDYWLRYGKLEEYRDKNIFAVFAGALNITALFTEKAVYSFEKKLLFKKAVVEIPWQEARLEAKVDLDFDGTFIYLNGRKIFDMLGIMDYSLIGLSKKDIADMDKSDREKLENEWAMKLNKVLADIPKRIKEIS